MTETEVQEVQATEEPVQEEYDSSVVAQDLLSSDPNYQALQQALQQQEADESQEKVDEEPAKEPEAKEEVQEVQEVPLRKQEREIRKKFQRLTKQQEELDRKTQEIDAILKEMQEDPVSFLQSKGVTLSEWAKRQVETPEIKAMKEIDKLRQELKEKEERDKLREMEAQETQYQKQLQSAIQQEFKSAAEKYTTLSVLIQDQVLNEEAFWPYIASDIQEQFDQTGEKPDLEIVFQRYEDVFRRLAESLSKVYNKKKTGGKPDVPFTVAGKEKNPPRQTLSASAVQSPGPEKEPSTPEEIEAMVRARFGL